MYMVLCGRLLLGEEAAVLGQRLRTIMAPVDQISRKSVAGLSLRNDLGEYEKPRRNGRDNHHRNNYENNNGHNGKGGGHNDGGGGRHGVDNGLSHHGGPDSDKKDDEHFEDYGQNSLVSSLYTTSTLDTISVMTLTTVSPLPLPTSTTMMNTAMLSTTTVPALSSTVSSFPQVKSYSSSSTSITTSIPPRLAETTSAYTSISSSTSIANLDKFHNHHSNSHALTAALITVGSISAFILLTAIIYLIFRAKAGGFSSLHKGLKGTLFPWKKSKLSHSNQTPPTYDDIYHDYSSDAKGIPIQRQFDAFAANTLPQLAKPGTAAQAPRPDVARLDMTREALLDHPAPFSFEPVPVEASEKTFYNTEERPVMINIKKATIRSLVPPSRSSQQDSSTPYMTSLSRQTSDAYDPAQREVNRVSDLSYISSGFGDAQILVPGSRRSKANPAALDQTVRRPSQFSLSRISRFSWVTNPQSRGDRDTIYTSTSVESAPRFRSISSWVTQQTNRIDKRHKSNETVPKVPDIPASVSHLRKSSDDPAFQHHPGDEVEISKGSRVPSEILDKRFAVNRLP
ncbi:hypothetical protein B7463_g7478, partial [Scytalidium lignicola]